MLPNCTEIAYVGAEETNCIDECVYNTGDNSFAPWQILGDSVVVLCGEHDGWFAATGRCWFNLESFARLSYTITNSTIGATYTVVMSYGASNQTNNPKDLHISLNGHLVATFLPDPSIDEWRLVYYSFLATQTVNQITIYNNLDTNVVSAYIDTPRIYMCVNVTEVWCYETFPRTMACHDFRDPLDFQENICGCGNGVLDGDCNALLWNFSLEHHCAPDNGTGVFNVCENVLDVVSKSYLGPCQELGTFNYHISAYCTPNSTNFTKFTNTGSLLSTTHRRRSITTTTTPFTTLNLPTCGQFLTDTAYYDCGVCSPLLDTESFVIISCISKTITFYLDSDCTYPYVGPSSQGNCTYNDYTPDCLFVLEGSFCPMIQLGLNCSNSSRLNVTDDTFCWSVDNFLPNGTFGGTPYLSFIILCPNAVFKFYESSDCTGPPFIPPVPNATMGCISPILDGVDISADTDFLCHCELALPPGTLIDFLLLELFWDQQHQTYPDKFSETSLRRFSFLRVR
jgi:hypothetical protein